MKKLLILMLCAVMALGSLTTLALSTGPSGTYSGSAVGNNGPIKVEVVLEGGEIQSVRITEHTETPGIYDIAAERIPAQIVEHQSLAVDTVTSATNTSQGILDAVEDAIAKAGGDVEAYKAVAVEKTKGEAVEMTADIIVVGGGGAGLAAALTAGESGASVIIVEKSANYGGNTILSGGYMQSAVDELAQTVEMTEGQKEEVVRYYSMDPVDEYMSKWQAVVKEQYAQHLAEGKTHLFDSAELHMIQTYAGGDYMGNPELIEKFCLDNVDTFFWLEDKGFSWKNSAVAIVGSIWMRCHLSADYPSGQGFIATMDQAIKTEGLDVDTVFDVRANHLLKDESGKITGVTGVSTIDGTEYTFHAGKSVILATGGFGANVEMRMQYDEIWGNLNENVPTTNAATITGDGIVMALEAGASTVDMGQIQLLPIADPVSGITSNVIGEGTNMYVNQEGKRFVDESSRRDILAKAILEQPGSYCYVISTFWNSRMDETYKNNYGLTLDYLKEIGAVVEGATLEELAEKIGVPADAFVETCTNFNLYAANSNDAEFGRVVFPANAALEMEGPFYACKRAPAVHHTMGGLEVNTSNQVLNLDGAPIAGLYAAGEVTGDFHGSNRLGGNALAEAITTGRNAGMHATQE